MPVLSLLATPLVAALALGSPPTGVLDPLACMQGRWAGVRAETLPATQATRGAATALQLRARATQLDIVGDRIHILTRDGALALHYRAQSVAEARAWIQLDRVVPPMTGDLALFELLDRDSLRAGLVQDQPFVFRRLADPTGGLAGISCEPPKPEPNPATPLLGQWELGGWRDAEGEPEKAEDVWISSFPGALLLADGETLTLTMKGQTTRARYRVVDREETGFVISTELPLIDGRYGSPSTLSFRVDGSDALRVESLALPDRFLLLARRGQAPAAATAEAPESRRQLPPFEVPYTAECESGALPRGAAPPDGLEQWCERGEVARGAEAMRHGWFIRWHANGHKKEAGRYADGLEHGVWMRWDAQGRPRVRAEFDSGIQQGLLIRWNELGDEVQAVEYRSGEPVQP